MSYLRTYTLMYIRICVCMYVYTHVNLNVLHHLYMNCIVLQYICIYIYTHVSYTYVDIHMCKIIGYFSVPYEGERGLDGRD